MKSRVIWYTTLALILLLLTSCNDTSTPSADEIATAIAGTQQISEMQSIFETATQLAKATDTPQSTSTDTPTPTDTPIPSSTPTPVPPEGMAYVPDFIGMPYEDARKILVDMGSKKWYYVATIKQDIDEWVVYMQEPEPGTLIDLDDDRVKLVVAVYEFTPTPTSEPRQGKNYSDACGDITYQGICADAWNVVWCEGGKLWIWDCAAYCGGVCGWYNSTIGFTCFCP